MLSIKDRIIELNLARNAKKSWQNLQLDMILDAKYKFCIIDELREVTRNDHVHQFDVNIFKLKIKVHYIDDSKFLNPNPNICLPSNYRCIY